MNRTQESPGFSRGEDVNEVRPRVTADHLAGVLVQPDGHLAGRGCAAPPPVIERQRHSLVVDVFDEGMQRPVPTLLLGLVGGLLLGVVDELVDSALQLGTLLGPSDGVGDQLLWQAVGVASPG